MYLSLNQHQTQFLSNLSVTIQSLFQVKAIFLSPVSAWRKMGYPQEPPPTVVSIKFELRVAQHVLSQPTSVIWS